MAGSRSAMAVAACVVAVMGLAHCATAIRFDVGGPIGWSVEGVEFGRDPNFFQNWAHRHYPFHTSDQLEFRWAAGDSVLQVTYADFTACNTRNPIMSWVSKPDGGETQLIFKLSPTNKYSTLYFISGEADNCRLGQKMYIDVFE